MVRWLPPCDELAGRRDVSKFRVSKIRILASGVVKFARPCVDDRSLVDIIDGGETCAPRVLVWRRRVCDASHGAGELGEQDFDEVQPRAMLWSEAKFEPARKLCRVDKLLYLEMWAE